MTQMAPAELHLLELGLEAARAHNGVAQARALQRLLSALLPEQHAGGMRIGGAKGLSHQGRRGEVRRA
jgi:hypothetical protein